jgi:transcriptional regulator with XRE-family HTH domain
MESFGEYIKSLRKQKGLNQTQLAAMLGLDMSAISKIENKKIQLKEKLLTTLAEIFDLEINVVKEKYFSDKFAREVYKNSVPETVFKVAEKKVKYYKATDIKQIDLNL